MSKIIFKVVKHENGDYIEMTNDDGSISWVPMIEGNRHYDAYLKSLKDETNTL